MHFAVGIDIGGGSAKLGSVNSRGQVLSRRTLPTPDAGDARELAAAYATEIETLLEKTDGGTPLGIGVGVPGHLDAASRSCTSGNVPLLDNFPLADFLEDRFSLPVRLDNDATLAALAEHRFGAGQSARRLLVVTLGTGIGLGLVIGDEPQRPVRGCMGDPGHIIVDPQATWNCRQGCKGCLESVASSLALERDAHAAALWKPDSELGRLLNDDRSPSAARIIGAAHDGTDEAIHLIEKAGTWIGMAAASWCAFYDPDQILFGGGLSSAGRLLLTTINKTMKTVGMPEYVAGRKIGLAKLKNDAGLIGAAYLFLR